METIVHFVFGCRLHLKDDIHTITKLMGFAVTEDHDAWDIEVYINNFSSIVNGYKIICKNGYLYYCGYHVNINTDYIGLEQTISNSQIKIKCVAKHQSCLSFDIPEQAILDKFTDHLKKLEEEKELNLPTPHFHLFASYHYRD